MKKQLILLFMILCFILFSCSPKIPSNKLFLNYVNNPRDSVAIKNLLAFYSKENEVENYMFLMWKTVLEAPFSKLSVSLLDSYISILYYIKLHPQVNVLIKKTFDNGIINYGYSPYNGYSSAYWYSSKTSYLIPDYQLRVFLYKFDKDSLNLPVMEKNYKLVKNFFEDINTNSLKLNKYEFESNYEYEHVYFAKFYLDLHKRDLTEPFSYYIFAAYCNENEEIRNWLNNNSEKVFALEDFLKNYQWQKIQ